MQISYQFKKAHNILNYPRIIIGLLVLVFLIFFSMFADFLAPYSLLDTDLESRLCPPNKTHLLGCDMHGGDLLSSLIYGAQTSFYVALLTLVLSLIIGITLGLIAGYLGKWVDSLIMRLVDILMAFPGILLAMALAAIMGPSLHNVILSIAATGWTSTARLVRGQVLTLKNREYVIASQAIGASVPRTLFFHLLPSIFPHLLITATFSLSGVILTESSLSFLGLGAQDSAPSWGAILSQGKEVLLEAPHLSIFPGLAILFVVLSFNFLGDGLRDLLDPRDQ